MTRTWASWTGEVTGPTMSKAREVVAAAAVAGHTIRVVHGKDSNPSNTEHYSGRALDFMTFATSALSTTDRAIGDWVADYLWARRQRLGLKWIIWRQRIRSTSPGASGQWVGMADRGSPTNNHMDHVHAYFDSSAYRAPSGGVAPTPSPAPQPEEESIMAGTIKKFGNGTKRTITNKKWHSLDLNGKGAVSLAAGPANVAATVQLEADIGEGCTLAVRFYTVNYKAGSTTKVVTVYAAAAEAVHTGGKTYLTVPYLDYIGKAPSGWSRRLRVQVLATGGNVTLEKNWARVLTEKK